eukprot:TRINITY_DN6815_c0_g1_i1.p1 TRINITY_DN6815_c0_g1~~TRINITY_DN6815_c0_g1_i1.p1  ORF type:complete len:191 (-),score=36.02 TRINITY_DN6815_c0_g1_i1:20-592(-)
MLTLQRRMETQIEMEERDQYLIKESFGNELIEKNLLGFNLDNYKSEPSFKGNVRIIIDGHKCNISMEEDQKEIMRTSFNLKSEMKEFFIPLNDDPNKYRIKFFAKGKNHFVCIKSKNSELLKEAYEEVKRKSTINVNQNDQLLNIRSGYVASQEETIMNERRRCNRGFSIFFFSLIFLIIFILKLIYYSK